MSDTTRTLRGGGSALVLAQAGTGLPHVLHWGPDLPDAAVADLALLTARPVPDNALDEPWLLTLLPTSGEGWLGTPGYAAHRAGGRTAPAGWHRSRAVTGPRRCVRRHPTWVSRWCCATGSTSTACSSSTRP